MNQPRNPNQNPNQQYNPQYIPQDMPIPQTPMDQMYDREKWQDVDMPEKYGSIIKELTDTEGMLVSLEARWRGKKVENGKILVDKEAKAFIQTDQAARDLIDIIRSKVNRHVDFSYYDEKEANERILGASALINRWLMFQGEVIPLRYRMKIADEAMSLIDASYHKSTNGRILVWTKGTFSEGMNVTHNPGQSKGLMDYIWPFKNKQR